MKLISPNWIWSEIIPNEKTTISILIGLVMEINQGRSCEDKNLFLDAKWNLGSRRSSSGAGRLRSSCRLFLGFLDSWDSWSRPLTLPKLIVDVVVVVVVVVEVAAANALCRLIWPPKAWPDENSAPHIEHSWTLLDFTLGLHRTLLFTSCNESVVLVLMLFRFPFYSSWAIRTVVNTFLSSWSRLPGFGFLWLALCPPSAWNEGKCLSQVLHW